MFSNDHDIELEQRIFLENQIERLLLRLCYCNIHKMINGNHLFAIKDTFESVSFELSPTDVAGKSFDKIAKMVVDRYKLEKV